MVTKLELWELDENGFHIVVHARLQGKPIRMLIDTGANYSCFDKSFLENLGEGSPKMTGQDEKRVGIGGNDFETFITEVSGFQIGRTQMPVMEVRTLDLSTVNTMYQEVGFSSIQGILGGDFLRRHHAVISYDTLKLTLKD